MAERERKEKKRERSKLLLPKHLHCEMIKNLNNKTLHGFTCQKYGMETQRVTFCIYGLSSAIPTLSSLTVTQVLLFLWTKKHTLMYGLLWNHLSLLLAGSLTDPEDSDREKCHTPTVGALTFQFTGLSHVLVP